MKKQHVTLSDNDRTYLEDLISKGSLSAKMYKRAVALLELDRGSTFTKVAQIVGVTIQTASTWAQKYGENGLEFLTDKPRPGRPKEIDGITVPKSQPWLAATLKDIASGARLFWPKKWLNWNILTPFPTLKLDAFSKKRTQAPLEATVGNRQNDACFSRSKGNVSSDSICPTLQSGVVVCFDERPLFSDR
ncbi:MAG: helix-turn-helix domain-containing protein [Anaerolineae bacterium]|nr:helix-turn-helix domain-containing protein [Anaerolineae bacterium]